GEGVAPGNGLVGLHRDARNFAQHLAGGENMLAYDTGLVRVTIGANMHRHDNFFERGIACTLADAVDGALDLSSPGGHCGESIRYRHAKIVVAVSRDGDVLNSLHTPADHTD